MKWSAFELRHRSLVQSKHGFRQHVEVMSRCIANPVDVVTLDVMTRRDVQCGQLYCVVEKKREKKKKEIAPS